jgi:predicted branched-subunit amino acid permease
MRNLRSLIWVLYLVIGVIVAAKHHYFDHLGSLDAIVSMIFEVLLWPLVILGIDISVH